MEGTQVARRYAQALLELAEEQKSTDLVMEDMKVLLSTTNENRDFHNFLNSPLIKEDKKISVLDKLFSNFQELTSKFVHLLVKNKREMYLPLIAEEFIVKLNVVRGIVPMALTTAQQLDDGVKQNIIDKLSKMVKGTIELTEQLDEDLIGGFVVRMGDTQIDASVAHQINKMKQRLIR